MLSELRATLTKVSLCSANSESEQRYNIGRNTKCALNIMFKCCPADGECETSTQKQPQAEEP